MLILLTAALSGNYAARRLEQRDQRLQCLEQLCGAMCSELRYLLPTVQELLHALSAREEFASLTFLQRAAQGGAYPEAWQAAIASDVNLSEAERSILQTVGATLGSMDLDGQLAALTLCKERFAALHTAAASELKTRGRLYRSMGVLTGIFLVILLL